MFKNTNAFIKPVRNWGFTETSNLSQSDVHQEEVIKHGGGGNTDFLMKIKMNK